LDRNTNCKIVAKLYWKQRKEIMRKKKRTAGKAVGPCLMARRH
jgi:hypothetical protein